MPPLSPHPYQPNPPASIRPALVHAAPSPAAFSEPSSAPSPHSISAPFFALLPFPTISSSAPHIPLSPSPTTNSIVLRSSCFLKYNARPLLFRCLCLTEITVPSQPQTSFNMTPRAPPTPSLILHKFSLFRQPPPARSYPHAQYSFSSPVPELSFPHPHSSHSANILFVPAISLQTLDSIDSRVNSYPFLPYFIQQLTSIDPATPIVPVCSVPYPSPLTCLTQTQCRVPPPQDATIDHCPNSIPPFQDAPKCLQRDGPSPYASQKRA
ncbi:hypothetical protein PAPYR_10807 [Paratrimastix pyriformis]|uniref:Uncharacterized protein n=1 Tax=Paratrimastix pyriformis TaxID=342808 RepID=A0ABQ8U6Z2_9EUKA|nr:hypothetical protein PAPYR_10807 [Paratrimastix pyriformis]